MEAIRPRCINAERRPAHHFALIAGRTHVGLTAPDGPKVGGALKRRALHRSTPTVENIHRVEQMLRLADLIGIGRVAELVCPAGAAPAQIAPGENYAVIHAAPMFRYKQWTHEGWRALAAELKRRGLSVVAIGGPNAAERKYLDEVFQGVARFIKWRGRRLSHCSRRRVSISGPTRRSAIWQPRPDARRWPFSGRWIREVWAPWPVGGLKTSVGCAWRHPAPGQCLAAANALPCTPCQLEGCEHGSTATANASTNCRRGRSSPRSIKPWRPPSGRARNTVASRPRQSSHKMLFLKHYF